MDEETANNVIMAARAHWFDGEETPQDPAADTAPVAQGAMEAGHDD
jgi:hypothetical protein